VSLRDLAAPETFVWGIPKAELHIHIEGSLEPELMFDIAERNGVALRYSSVEEVRRAYNFSDLQSFLDVYYEATRVLLHEQDFYDLTRAFCRKPRPKTYATPRYSSILRLTRTEECPSKR
jgi:adenine deaminase